MEQTNRLNGKDFINIGIFTAIYFVITLIVSMLGFIPIMLPGLAVIVPLVAGIPFMLFLTRVRKFGMVLIMGIILGIIMSLTGMGWPPIVTGAVAGLMAEFVIKSGNYTSTKKAILANAVFSLWIMGNFITVFFSADFYSSREVSIGPEYVAALKQLLQPWVFPVLIVCCLVFGYLGGLWGKAILKKHFEKAGMA